ncbi:MAG: hypothetical protein OSB68_04360 [Dehalococcoidia bacterium]|nr:hypothetical protein [Dehalococcoidia bacterium]
MAQQSGDLSNTASYSSEAETLYQMAMKLLSDRKLIVVLNRGPLNFAEDHSRNLVARRDPSQLSEMFESLSDLPIFWVSGVPGRKAAEKQVNDFGVLRKAVLPKDWKVMFVSSPRRVHHKLYNVICNPLFDDPTATILQILSEFNEVAHNK